MAKHPAPVAAPVVPVAVVPAAPAAPSAPSVPAAPAAPLPPAPSAVFPPAGWLPHPSAPGYFYQGQEVLDEAALRARSANPALDNDVPPWEQ